FALFTVIYANTTSLAGWTKEQVFFFLGIFFASDAINATFFQRNFWQFSDLVNKGELDILLTKPVSPAFLALTRWMSLTSIMTFLPFAFIGSVPTRALLFGLTLKETLGVAAVLIGFYVFDVWFWRRGLRRYQSASS